MVVATAQAIERDGVASALDLATTAAEECLASAPGLRRRVQLVSVVNILSRTSAAPAAVVARRLGLAPARTEVTTIGGNSPQWLISRAADAIAAGELHTTLIVGAEAQHSARVQGGGSGFRRAHAQGVVPAAGTDAAAAARSGAVSATASEAGPDEGDGDLPPDTVVGDQRPGIGAAEAAIGLMAPVHVYALFESAIAARAGRGAAEQRRVLGELMAPFTSVAAAHPQAWFPAVRAPVELATVTSDNRLVAEPYAKLLCAFLNVNQAAAVLVTSLAAARAAGVAERAVFCWSGADAADVWFPSARPDLGSSPGLRAAGEASLHAAGIGVDDVDRFDLYSCFPCAVEMAASALTVRTDDSRGLTVTGGLPYFGGPGNNYSLHGVATMVEHLRQRGGIGLVSAMGWYATKHAVGIYGPTPPTRGWHRGETVEAQQRIDDSALPVADDAQGPAVVVAATAVPGPDGQVSSAPVIARLADGRQVAAAANPDELASVTGRDLVGEHVEVSGSPPHYRVTH